MFEERPSLYQLFQQIKNVCTWQFLIQFCLGVVGLISIGGGTWQLLKLSNQHVSCSIPQAQELKFTKPIVVSVTGAVKNPGIVSLPPGSRLGQVIDQVGGFAPDVDMEFLNRELNLATVIADQEQVFIPFYSVTMPGSQTDISPSNGISLNTATASQLETLPGIGSKRAADIVDGRPYQNINQLIEKGVLTDTLLENIKSEISL